MTSSKQVTRMCAVTRTRKKRSELIRITKKNDNWHLNMDNKLEGRSLYLDISQNKVIEKFEKQQRRFKINDENMQEIVMELKRMRDAQNI